MTMSDQPGMSHDELIAALRKDMAATSAERNAASAAGTKSMADLTAERKQHADAVAEIARLEAEAKAKSTPDAQITAGLHALRVKLFG
jgi:hypothetical protein